MAQIAIRAEGAEDIVRAVDEQLAQIDITGLGDAQLRVTVTRLVSPGDETQSWTDVAAPGKAFGVFESEDEGQGGERTHAADALELEGLGIAFLTEELDLAVVSSDLLSEGCDGVEDGEQSWLERVRNGVSNFVSEVRGRAGGQTKTGALSDPTDVVDEQGAGSNQSIS